MQRLLLNLLPDTLIQKIRRTNYYSHRAGSHLASTSKRLDLCAAQFAHVFHLSKHQSIEDKICLEIGAGWVLSHALVCYLLGARKVIATDITPNAQPETISVALKDAIFSIPRDILAPFSDHSRIRKRLDRLMSIKRFSFDTLKDLGIHYLSPIDIAVEKPNTSVDFIYSFSVLEHVTNVDVPALLKNLVANLNHGGTMIHCIHLEDHKDFSSPFDFLDIPDNQYHLDFQSERGNRIRCSEWRRIFGDLEGTKTDFIYNYCRLDKALPELIDPSISYCDEDDLRTSHIGVYTRKEE